MEILRKINTFFYTTRFSVFDLIWIVVIGNLAGSYSYWWFLLLVPLTAFSVIMERHLDKE
jgi:hypothetical protein